MSARTILTLANGKGIDLRHPRPHDIDFDVMAEMLAKEKRFNGATPGIEYSVADHLSFGIDAILEVTDDMPLAAYWSLHDAPEHVLKDDTTPKKRALAEEIEEQCGILAPQIIKCMDDITARHDLAVHTAALLRFPMSEDIARQVKQWDLRMFVTEWRDLMPGFEHPDWGPYADIVPLEKRIVPSPDWQTAAHHLRTRWEVILPVFANDKARRLARP